MGREQIVRLVVVLGWTLGIAAIGVGWVYTLPRLQAYAAESFPAGRPEIVLPELPAWLDTEQVGETAATDGQQRDLAQIKSSIVSEITGAARTPLSNDPFSFEELQSAYEAMKATGWFADLERIERIGPHTLRVEGTFVTPFTMIRWGRWNHLVTREARLLPLKYPQTVRLKRMPLITGARFTPPDRPGAAWEGRDIEAGLNLLETFLGYEWLDQVAEIDVSEFLHTGQVWITTSSGARILWGRPPGEERGIEVPARTKLEYLTQLFKDFGRIEGHFRELDITGDSVYAR